MMTLDMGLQNAKYMDMPSSSPKRVRIRPAMRQVPLPATLEEFGFVKFDYRGVNHYSHDVVCTPTVTPKTLESSSTSPIEREPLLPLLSNLFRSENERSEGITAGTTPVD